MKPCSLAASALLAILMLTLSLTTVFADPIFALKADYGTGTNPISVAIGDLTVDGKRDLATANPTATTVSVLPGIGDGTFGAKTDFATATGPQSVAIGDLNADARADLVTANYTSSTVSVLLNASTTGVGPTPSDLPRTFQLLASRPNPSQGTSEIRFLLPSACTVDVALFDLAGRRVRSLVSGERSMPGEHSIRWDGRDGSGAPVRGGVYLVQVRAGSDVGVGNVIVLR